ncbi:MAG: tetratricopeptide repeat-containing serine protease family protein [Cyanobacteria bacterium P01_G01_bin.39]
MNRYLLVPFVGIFTTLNLGCQPALNSERSLRLASQTQVSAIAKEFTVHIEGEETTGTGTIVKQDGNIYTILTCWHVVNAAGGFEVTTIDNQVHQVTTVKNLESDIDLAILQFTSTNPYEVAALGDSTAITKGTNSYVVSYPPDPDSEALDRAYTFQNADIISRQSQADKGYQIVHNNPTTLGSSGGGMFDNEGNLIGINCQTTSDAEERAYYGLAIPIELYLAAQNSFVINPAQDFVSVGQRKLNQEDYQGAIVEFNQALAINPNDFDALSGRGQAYFSLRDFDAAEQDFAAVLQRNSNNAISFVYRGNAYLGLGEQDKAIADFNEAIRIDPNLATAYSNRGLSYHYLEEYQRAITDFNEAIRIDSNLATAYSNRGFSYNNLGEYSRALATLNQAIRIDPDLAIAWNNRGLSYRGFREYNKAITDFDQAIRLDPDFAEAYNNRGGTYDDLGEYQRAINDYNEAIRLNPEYASPYYNRGNTYDSLGENNKAINDFQQAADLYQQQGYTGILYQRALDKIKELQ